MQVLHYILFGIILIYSLWMLVIIFGWLFLSKTSKTNRITEFSVLIPFRNERENIPTLLNSLSKIDYKKTAVEFIFVNDHSTDNGVKLLNSSLVNFPFKYKVVDLPSQFIGKKQAIELGIKNAKFDKIVTVDADCIYSSDWLAEINQFFDADFIIGPVVNKESSGILSNLQQIEALLLAGITVGSGNLKFPMLCSGANLAYNKSLFYQQNPYKNNKNVMSGDDMFFLEKVVKHKRAIKVAVNYKSVVQTKAPVLFSEMYARSIRWAAKSSRLKLLSTSIFGAIVLITNYSILFMIAMIIFKEDGIVFFIKLCSIKTIIDVLFLVLLANQYNRFKTLIYFPIMVVFYPVYLLLVSIGTIFFAPSWKGR